MTAFGVEVRDVVVNVSAGASGMSADDLSKQLPQLSLGGAAAGASAGSSSGGFAVLPWLQLWATLGSLYYVDLAIKGVLTQYAIKFPSALVGMFGVFGLLCAVGDKTADKILAFYAPALNWIARWLPIFYVPALVTLPLALQGIPGVVFSAVVVCVCVIPWCQSAQHCTCQPLTLMRAQCGGWQLRNTPVSVNCSTTPLLCFAVSIAFFFFLPRTCIACARQVPTCCVS